MNSPPKRTLQFVFAILILMGITALLWLTQSGPGLFDWDSFNYLASARSFAAGDGFEIPYSDKAVRPMTHYPPFFPALLGGLVFFGADPILAARWLNIILYTLNAILFGLLLWRITQTRWLTLLGGILFLLSADLLIAHAWALSEPLLITLVLTAMLAADRGLVEHKQGYVWLSLLCVGLAVLTKFMGAAISATLGLIALFYLPQWRTRLQYFFGYALAGSLPILLWSWRTYVLTQTFNNRGLVSTPISKGNLLTAFFTFYTWLIPQRWLLGNERTFLIVSIVVSILLLFGWFGLRRKQAKSFTLPFLVSAQFAYAGLYMLLVFLAKMFFDPGIGFRTRMFIPLYPALLLILLWIIHEFFAFEGFWSKIVALGLASYFLLSAGLTSLDTLPPIAEIGLGWNRRAIITAEPLQELQQILAKENIDLYSNELFGTYFHTGRAVPRLGTFPPETLTLPVYVLLYNERIDGKHALPNKYPATLVLIAEDDIFSLYAYLPE